MKNTFYIAFIMNAVDPCVYQALGLGTWDEAKGLLKAYNKADCDLTFCVEVAPEEERVAMACQDNLDALAGIAREGRFFPRWAETLYLDWLRSPDRECNVERNC